MRQLCWQSSFLGPVSSYWARKQNIVNNKELGTKTESDRENCYLKLCPFETKLCSQAISISRSQLFKI